MSRRYHVISTLVLFLLLFLIFVKLYFWILCGVLSSKRGTDVQRFADFVNLKISKWPDETKCWTVLKSAPLNLPEDLLPVEQVGYEHPYGGGQEVLCQMLCMWLVVGHLPAKGEVLFKHLVTHVHQDGIHTWQKK